MRRLTRRAKFMFCIRVTLTFGKGRETKKVFVAEKTQWDGSWYTDDPKKAKFWLMRNYADAWLMGRSDLRGEVIKLERDDKIIENSRKNS